MSSSLHYSLLTKEKKHAFILLSEDNSYHIFKVLHKHHKDTERILTIEGCKSTLSYLKEELALRDQGYESEDMDVSRSEIVNGIYTMEYFLENFIEMVSEGRIEYVYE